MSWKLIDGKEGKANVVETGENGHPVWIPDEEGEKTPVEVDWSSALSTISRLNGENKTRREEGETLTGQLKEAKTSLSSFGDLDPKAAKEAITKLASIAQGDLLTADKVESFKASVLQAAQDEKNALVTGYDTKIGDLEKKVEKGNGQIYKLVVSNAFANSPYIEKIQVPRDMVEAFFGHCFKVEDGLPVGYMNGNKINSRKNPGNPAAFDEAIEIIIEQYPDKDKLFPGSSGGSGGQGGGGNHGKMGADQIKDLSLAQYEQAKKDNLI